MKKLKDYTVGYPEYYLLIVMMLACYPPPFGINALGITAAVALTFQVVFKLRLTGILIGSFFFLLNFYLIFALLDELLEFSEMNSSVTTLGMVGIVFIGANLTMSVLMISKYLRARKDQVAETA